MTRSKFLRLLRAQLAKDRGPDADSTPLYLFGSTGALFKLRLSAYGYTIVAKGVEKPDLARLHHEKNVYDQLRPIQGKDVPVCVGLIDLVLPLYYDGGVYEHLILLSWAGRPLPRCIGQMNDTSLLSTVTRAFTNLHRLQVLHGDAEARNITYDGRAMIVDFERAELRRRQSLASISPNSQSRKRKRGKTQRQDDPFTRELQSVLKSVAKCAGNVRGATMTGNLESGSALGANEIDKHAGQIGTMDLTKLAALG